VSLFVLFIRLIISSVKLVYEKKNYFLPKHLPYFA
jgi:hypothetical protein